MKLPNATATSSISDAVSRQPHIRSPDEVTTSVRPLPTPLLWRPSDSKRRFGVKSEPLGAAILIGRIAARTSSCELSLDMGRRFRVDQGLHERRPIGKDEMGRDGSDVLEEAGARAFGGSGLGPELFEAVADRMECEGEEVHGGEHHGEVLLAVAEVVLKVVAVALEDVEAFVLDLPSGPAAGHDLGDGVAGDGQRGHESTAVSDVALGVRDADADPADEHRVVAVPQWRALEPAEARGQALAVGLLRDRVLIERGTLHEVIQRLVRRGLGCEEEIPAGGGDRVRNRLAREQVVAEVDGPQIDQ